MKIYPQSVKSSPFELLETNTFPLPRISHSGETGNWTELLNRKGSGVVAEIYRYNYHHIKVWIDGKLAINVEAVNSSGGANLIDRSVARGVPYLSYSKSIKIEIMRISNDFDSSSFISHVVS